MKREPTIRDVLDQLHAVASTLTSKVDNVSEAVHDLATHMDERFETVDRRFEAIDQRFEAIDHRFEAIDQRFESMGRRFESMDQRFEAMDQRFEDMEERFDAKLHGVEMRLMDHIDGFVNLHRTMDVELASLRAKSNRHDDFLVKSAKRLDMDFERT